MKTIKEILICTVPLADSKPCNMPYNTKSDLLRHMNRAHSDYGLEERIRMYRILKRD